MLALPDLIRQGATAAWLFVPSAVLLGALHGLEPGHSKSLMAAFIVAIRGTVTQAVLLGLSAAISHTAMVWLVALLGLYLGESWDVGSAEPYFQLVTGVAVVLVALWMAWRTWTAATRHDHDHHHDDNSHHPHQHSHASKDQILDPHERAHASEIDRRFGGRPITTRHIILFGLTGGFVPCPAAITVLLLCLQVRQFTLGIGLVLAFSIGLALTMVSVGAAAALSTRHLSRKWPALENIASRAPYASAALMLIVGIYMTMQGLTASHI